MIGMNYVGLISFASNVKNCLEQTIWKKNMFGDGSEFGFKTSFGMKTILGINCVIQFEFNGAFKKFRIENGNLVPEE